MKQASHAWFDKLSKFLLQLGFYCNKTDSSLFIFQENKTTILFLICINDILIARNNDRFITTLITKLGHDSISRSLGIWDIFLVWRWNHFPMAFSFIIPTTFKTYWNAPKHLKAHQITLLWFSKKKGNLKPKPS